MITLSGFLLLILLTIIQTLLYSAHQSINIYYRLYFQAPVSIRLCLEFRSDFQAWIGTNAQRRDLRSRLSGLLNQ